VRLVRNHSSSLLCHVDRFDNLVDSVNDTATLLMVVEHYIGMRSGLLSLTRVMFMECFQSGILILVLMS